MVKINLLPASLLAERKRQRAQGRFLLLSGVVMLVLAAGFGFLFIQTMEIKSRLAVVSAERAAVEAEIARYSVYTKLQAEVNSKAGILKKVMGRPLPWVEVLEEVGAVIPPNVWLTDFLLTAGKEGEAGQLTLRGLTYDHPSTARWVAALREVNGVADVRVMFSAEEKKDNIMLVRFEVRAGLLPGVEYDPLAKKGE